jgi:fused signal recognition particle receptor
MLNFLKSTFLKVKSALSKTRSLLGTKIQTLFSTPWDESTFESLEQIFYEADLGVALSEQLTNVVKSYLKKNPKASQEMILEDLKRHALSLLEEPTTIKAKKGGPHVILIVGVNGSGKTTTIAKLAEKYRDEGKKVLLAAGDTFRAAAIDQLSLWADFVHVEIVKSKPGSDPAAVVFDALTKAKAKNFDVVLIDTAGRLQNKTDLMNELEKIKRTCAKIIDNSPHETLIILDATTGQNALDQARIFNQFTPLTGIALTKLDGTAKGGIILSIYSELKVPILWIGVGEKADDLLPFDPASYVDALFTPS